MGILCGSGILIHAQHPRIREQLCQLFLGFLGAEAPVLQLAAAQDYDAFFEQEIAYRKLGLYPPFCGLCVIGFAGAKEIEVARAAARFAALLGQQAAKQPDLPLRVLGPTPGSIEKINDTYRYKLTIKCRNDRRFRDLVRSTLERYEQEKLPSKATVAVDLHSDGDI